MNNLADDLDFIYSHSQGVFNLLRGRSIFITGGTGFFGKWLLESFNWANQHKGTNINIVVLSRDPSSFKSKLPHLQNGISFIQGDIQNFCFPQNKFDYIIHAATQASAKLNEENPGIMLDSIIGGTRRVLQFAQTSGVKRVLHTSSGAIYGTQPPEFTHIPETFMGGPNPLTTASAYGEGKRVSELLGAIFTNNTGIDFINARCFAFVGPYLPLDTHFAIGNFINDAINQRDIVIKGDGTPYRSYLYAADLMIWLLKILTHGKSCEAYNVGSAEGIQIKDLAQLVVETDNKLKVTINKASSGALPSRYVPAVDKAQKELGLQVYTSLKDAISKTLNYNRLLS
ncbi:MAG: NAD(P)-dependent oxidoreductase [Bacteriovoracaceae bacterium]|nr:NAD(P)-dependent oxidoreductase [Bacteriovoracaceae bacterium]